MTRIVTPSRHSFLPFQDREYWNERTPLRVFVSLGYVFILITVKLTSNPSPDFILLQGPSFAPSSESVTTLPLEEIVPFKSRKIKGT